MAMMRQTYSISGLSVELGISRRTLAKKLDTLPPAEEKGKSRRYYMADVFKRLHLFDHYQTSDDEQRTINNQHAADETAWFFDHWAPTLLDCLWEELTQFPNMEKGPLSEQVVMLVMKIWEIQLEALGTFLGLENTDLVDIPEIIENLNDVDRFQREASFLVEIDECRQEKKSEADLGEIFVDLSEI